MASSESSTVINSWLRIRPIEGDDDLAKAAMDFLRVHVCLIMVGALTMEESKLVLDSAFFALRRFGLDNMSAWLSYTGDRLESLLARREKARLLDVLNR